MNRSCTPVLLLAAAALAACGSTASTTGSGGTAGGAPPPTSLTGASAPAAKGGYCIIGPHSIANRGGTITGTLSWDCQGSVVMNLNVRLIYVDNNTGDEARTHPDEGAAFNFDSILYSPPQTVTAPCHTGLWKMKIVGQVTPAIGPELTVNTSDKTNPPFNTPAWQTPTAIEC